MKHKALFFLFLTFAISGLSQNKRTTCIVDKKYHDFGTIKEDGGKVKAVFTFKNTGNKNLLILNAEPSCGCTLGEWTKDTIPPGKSGTVTAIFDPKNMVGIIDKTIGVYTNAMYSAVIVLELRGEVVPRDKSLSDVFPYRVGNLMFDKEMIELGDVPHNAADSAYVVMYNDGQYPIKINGITALPDGFRIRPAKLTVEPGQEVRLYAALNANTLQDYGSFNKAFRLLTDDPEVPEKLIYLFGNVKYNFGKLSKKDLKNAPKISLDKTSYEFGQQKMGSFVNATFIISNSGKNDLEILSLKAQCSCTVPSMEKRILKAGESAPMQVKFDLLGHAGVLQKPITIYTNDPKNPTVDVLVRAQLY